MKNILEHIWHDVEILELSMDRSQAGKNVTFKLVIEWSDWDPKRAGTRSILEFKDCYSLHLSMNFGIIARETIKDLWIETEHPKLDQLRNTFEQDDIACVVIETNSTASLIRIFATSYQISPFTERLRAS